MRLCLPPSNSIVLLNHKNSQDPRFFRFPTLPRLCHTTSCDSSDHQKGYACFLPALKSNRTIGHVARACYSISFNNRHARPPLPFAICISLGEGQVGNFYHRFTLGTGCVHPPAENYYSRHRGCFGVSFFASLCFTRVTGWSGGGGRVQGMEKLAPPERTTTTTTRGGGEGGRFRVEVSLQFNFYDAPCHFYPGFCNGMQPSPPSFLSTLTSSVSRSPLHRHRTCLLVGERDNLRGLFDVRCFL